MATGADQSRRTRASNSSSAAQTAAGISTLCSSSGRTNEGSGMGWYQGKWGPAALRPEQGDAGVLLLDGFEVDVQVDVVGRRFRNAVGDAEVAALDGAAGAVAYPRVAFGAIAVTDFPEPEGDRLGHAMQRQIAGDRAFAGAV